MPSKYKYKPLSPGGIKTISLDERESKVDIEDFGKPAQKSSTFREFFNSLPDILASKDLKDLIEKIHEAQKKNKPIIFGLGAHFIKVGLNQFLIDLMKGNFVTAISMNGAGMIHDFEIAYSGKTSEDVEKHLKDGSFGMAEETGKLLSEAIKSGDSEELGLGESIGKFLAEKNFRYKEKSIFSRAYDLNIPVTVHMAIGTDTIHFYPDFSGESAGRASLRDFFLLSSIMTNLEGGVYLNIGSAVILPEVFLKALTFVRNKGYPIENFTTAVFDFIHHYRPYENVTKRPVGNKGKGYYFIGHHEIMIPLLFQALIEFK
ncbi:MAG: hypothetical protein AB1410_08985 [Acidobacteriota bacterium]